jgi:Holliday junction resolvasome RuvABC endonuclease subunit
MAIVLGVDPGFAALGWALVRLEASGEEILQLGVIRTAKSTRKLHVLASSDDHRRGGELTQALAPLVRGVTAICAEAVSHPPHSSAAYKVGRSWGVLDCLASLGCVPVVQVSPQQVKKRLGAAGLVTGGRRADYAGQNASKAAVHAALARRFAELPQRLAGLPKGLQEHALDALAVVVAALDSEVIRMARKMPG